MDELSWYLSLILFTVSTCGTPGPNNFMIMSSGVSYGVRRSMPHVIGINVGFPLMVVALGLGLGGLLQRYPAILVVLRPIGVAYLLYLAYRVATTPPNGASQARQHKPLTMLQAALFQVVNPKAWVMIVGALVTYQTADSPFVAQVLVIALIFLVFGTPCTVTWLLIGASLQQVLAKPAIFRAFNIAMAGLLVLSVVPAFGEIYRSVT
jgi:threonine/homoserine/homoserine lactone efflux protein